MTRPAAAHHPPERPFHLWLLAIGPGLWAAHFLACYLTAAIWCAKAAPGAAGGAWTAAALGPVRWAVAAYTAAALAGIGGVLWHGWRRLAPGAGEGPHEADTAVDRERFLAFATLLLSGLSAVATVYTALAAVFIGDCR
ncbi:MAG TPA: hypothetical protein VHM02_07140 [Thermoanaerobaculia bacterium]|nr:hypothetical protein [Thermoanaerobaculia bacterium]